MDMKKIVVEQNGPVRTIWMNRPEKRNALDAEMLEEMTAVMRADVAPEDRVVMIRGKGPAFCSGLDMAQRRQSMGTGNASGIEHMLRAIELCPLPVVAVVQGDAIAGGHLGHVRTQALDHADAFIAQNGRQRQRVIEIE